MLNSMLSVLESVNHDKYRDTGFFAETLEPAMMRTARAAAHNRARSYRGFFVGACGALLLGKENVVVFADGANNSPVQGVPRDCAEMDIIRHADELAAEHDGAVVLLDVYVAGSDDPDEIREITGLERATLPPCSDCRGLLSEHPAARNDTGVVTFGRDPASPALERATLEQVLALYDSVAVPKTSGQLLAELQNA
jgi:hypothetical protein